jgi:hypothetical protein
MRDRKPGHHQHLGRSIAGAKTGPFGHCSLAPKRCRPTDGPIAAASLVTLVGSQNCLLSFQVAGRAAINNLVMRCGRYCWHNRLDPHRRITAPTNYGHVRIMQFLAFV